jgi:response regulator NasT
MGMSVAARAADAASRPRTNGPGPFCWSETKEEGKVQAVAPSVLTAEDNAVARADLRLVLEEAGFDVVADARDGVEAVELAREHQPDVIVLDLGLPRLDGIQASRRILAERPVPIVALTGRSRALADEAIAAGASSFVLKPFHSAQVVEAVTTALATHREQQALDLRAASLRSLEHLVGQLGYPAEWAVELEQQAWERGHVWRLTAGGDSVSDGLAER